MTQGILRRPLVLLLALVPALFAACDNPVRPGDHEDDVVGVVITDLQNVTLAETQRQGNNVVWIGDTELRVEVGEELAVRIYFVAEDGDRIQFPFTGAEHTTRVTVANTGVATFEPHGDHGDFQGVALGSTTVRFAVWHGSHADWESPQLPLLVVPPELAPLGAARR